MGVAHDPKEWDGRLLKPAIHELHESEDVLKFLAEAGK
jgi:hypothetical protein